MRRQMGVAGLIWVASLSPAAAAPQAPQTAQSPRSETRLIDVAGRHVAFHLRSGRPPAVIFEAGAGMDGSAWDAVIGTIQHATGATTITFDRAGFGDSDEDIRPMKLQHEVDDLKAGLSTLGATRNLVLVAHSFGGEVGLSFAIQNPGWIVRAVLVDASVPSFFTDEEVAKIAAGFPKDIEQNDKQGRAMAATFAAFPTMQHEFHAMHWPDTIPAIVIVSEHPPFATSDQQALWTKVHIDFAQAAANRSVIVAKNSGHIVMADRPDVVSEAVIEAINQVRQTSDEGH